MKINCKKSIVLLSAIFAVVLFASCQNPFLIDATKLYKVSFETNGGTEIKSYRTSKIETSPGTNKTGYNFIGWTENSYSGKSVSFPLELESDTVLYAVWEICYYTVAFNSRGGTEIQSQSVPYNSVATLPDEPEKEESEFLGWYTDISFSEKFDFGTLVTADIMLYAKWKTNTYPVYFKNNGGIGIEKLDIEFKDYVPYDVTPTKIGYVFVSWYLDEELTQKFDFATPVTESITLYAKWEEARDTKYTVVHYKQNEQRDDYIVATSESRSGETNSLTAATAENYVGFTAKPFNQIAIKPDGTSIVCIYYDRNSYTVSFDANGGNGTQTAQTFYYGVEQKITDVAFSAQTGHEFVGWATNANSTKLYDNQQSVKISADITLYALWKPIEYTITYIDCGTNAAENPVSYTINSGTITLASPTKAKNTFDGWYETSDFTGNRITQISAGSTGNKTLYAKWVYGLIIKEEDVSTLDVTGYDGFYVKGALSESAMVTLAEKLQNATEAFSIDLSESQLTRIWYTSSSNNDIKGWFEDTKLKSIILPSTLRTLGLDSFENCTNLESITLPTVLEEISSRAFYGCENLVTITIPSSVTTIGSHVFSGCTKLKDISIPSSVKTIGMSVFRNCSSITEITIPNGVTKIESSTFYGCTNLKAITIPNSVTSIGQSAFSGCSSLTSITIPSSVTSIENITFSDCTSLSSIVIPNGVTEIRQSMFSHCTNLMSVSLPDSISSIGNYAFGWCNKLSSITFQGTMAQWNAIEKSVTWKNSAGVTKVICTDGTVEL